jgi:phosphodiesterase/alkaline phosphatase D-like protein
MRGLHTHRSLLLLAVTTTAGVVLTQAQIQAQIQTQIQTQILPPAKPATSVRISKGPELESVRDNEAIITWTSNNPGGTDEHFGIVHYGTDPEHLTQTAKSHIRLNQNHPNTVFRVRVDGLKPQTTYYYTVDSIQATGRSDGVKSKLAHFANP